MGRKASDLMGLVGLAKEARDLAVERRETSVPWWATAYTLRRRHSTAEAVFERTIITYQFIARRRKRERSGEHGVWRWQGGLHHRDTPKSRKYQSLQLLLGGANRWLAHPNGKPAALKHSISHTEPRKKREQYPKSSKVKSSQVKMKPTNTVLSAVIYHS